MSHSCHIPRFRAQFSHQFINLMQESKTLQFWNDFYSSEESHEKEWILRSNKALIQNLAQHVGDARQVLEIGCGTSTLSRDMHLFLANQEKATQPTKFVATDVSNEAIAQCKNRDSHIDGENLMYSVLDVTKQLPDAEFATAKKYDVVLDKGCLDTFLFRSRGRGGNKCYGDLIRNVLDNVHSMLNGSGRYLVISPRSKNKSLRDYAGFASVERFPLDLGSVDFGDLQENNKVVEGSLALYVCTMNPDYSPGSAMDAFITANTRTAKNSLPLDSNKCPKCSISFEKFRKGQPVALRGESYWHRQWKGHKTHCKD